jgi:hypothetical protein
MGNLTYKESVFKWKVLYNMTKKNNNKNKHALINYTQQLGVLCDLSSTSCFQLLHPEPFELRPKTHKSADKMQYYG